MMLLKQELERFPPRPLPIALAQVMANTKPGAYLDCLERLYLTLSPADKLRCRDELNRCRAAKREHLEARVA